MKTFLIVEGQGEVTALPVLVRRLVAEESLSIELSGTPWREPRQRILAREHLDAVLQVARLRAEAALIVLDSDDDCAVEVGRRIRSMAHELAPGFPTFVVAAVREFEGWFLAAAESLRGRRGLPADLVRPENPETIRDAKGWLSARMPKRYSPTLDQPAFCASMAISEAAAHSRSFRKFLKEVRAIGGA